MGESAVVVFSGGQDSTTCLAWALKRFGKVVALSFDYGQRHRVELEQAKAIAQAVNVPHIVLALQFPPASALNDMARVVAPTGGMDNLPSTFLPGRNATFLSLAASVAVSVGARNVVTGVCQTDFSGYPDCRQDFINVMEMALNQALGAGTVGDARKVIIHTPLMYKTKAETVRLAQDLDAMPLIAMSHTCYNGLRPACGVCPACQLRAKGFAEAGIADPAT